MRSKLDRPFVAAMALAGLLALSPLRAEEQKPPAGKPAVTEPKEGAAEPAKSGPEAGANPLTPIIEKMKETGDRLGQGLLDDETRESQKQIVADLEKLLRQSRQKSQSPQSPQSNSSGNPESDPSSSQSDSPETQGGSGPAGGQRRKDQKDAAESTAQTEGGIPTDAERKNQRRVLTDAVWGHLPPRVREELNRSISDRYLPEYEALVKRYYEALATRRRDAEPRGSDGDRGRGGSGGEARGGAPSP